MTIVSLIDHAILHPTQTEADVRAGCLLASQLGVYSVCVKPDAIPLAVQCLRGTAVKVGTVIGFPHGHHPTEVKLAESRWSIARGAVELDMVVNVGKVLAEDWGDVERDISDVVQAAHDGGAVVKVIFETDYVTREEWKRRLCEICDRRGADFVKTSTGFGFVKQPNGDFNYRGATVEDVRLMRAVCSPRVGVKASGGIRDYTQALALVHAGANRLGTSASAAIASGEGHDRSSY